MAPWLGRNVYGTPVPQGGRGHHQQGILIRSMCRAAAAANQATESVAAKQWQEHAGRTFGACRCTAVLLQAAACGATCRMGGGGSSLACLYVGGCVWIPQGTSKGVNAVVRARG